MSNELSASLRCEIDARELQDIARPPMGFGGDEPGLVRVEGSMESERGETNTGLDTKWTSSYGGGGEEGELEVDESVLGERDANAGRSASFAPWRSAGSTLSSRTGRDREGHCMVTWKRDDR